MCLPVHIYGTFITEELLISSSGRRKIHRIATETMFFESYVFYEDCINCKLLLMVLHDVLFNEDNFSESQDSIEG